MAGDCGVKRAWSRGGWSIRNQLVMEYQGGFCGSGVKAAMQSVGHGREVCVCHAPGA